MSQVGKNIAQEKLTILENNEWNETNISNGTVVIFAIPGAFTPVCSSKHLPGFIENYKDFLEKGVKGIYCLSVNDKFVMEAWGKNYDLSNLKLIADGTGSFTSKYSLEDDLSEIGLGIRSKRYAMIIRDGVAEQILFDDESFAENVIKLI
jgi:peroxiredoxin